LISLITGTLVTKDLDHVEVLTSGGTGYEMFVPLSTFEALPRTGEKVTLHTELVVREDAWSLYGFSSQFDRQVFRRLLSAKGVGPSLALGLLSTLSADRVTKALREKDIATLQQVPRVGRKKAEQMILDLADKLGDLVRNAGGVHVAGEGGAMADDAIRAMVSLGYTLADADRAVRKALESTPTPSGAPELIRAALPHISRR
jgi:Holliday junction DNA helicase RuvA